MIFPLFRHTHVTSCFLKVVLWYDKGIFFVLVLLYNFLFFFLCTLDVGISYLHKRIFAELSAQNWAPMTTTMKLKLCDNKCYEGSSGTCVSSVVCYVNWIKHKIRNIWMRTISLKCPFVMKIYMNVYLCGSCLVNR